jgi:hypothetical protein
VHQETELIVTAIESLKQEPNFFKDYIFPIASAFFTAILGAVIAYFTLNKQEKIQIEKSKMNAANKWTLDIEQARSCLIAIKGNYNGKLSNKPMQRLGATPSILFHAEPIIENFQDLSFIVPNQNIENSDLPKWSQIPRIRHMVSNYNYLLKMWTQRNESNEKFKQSLLKSMGGKAHDTLSLPDIEKAVSTADLVVLIEFTEQCIVLTDQIIIELDDFLSEFPDFVKTKIEIKKLKKYGSIITYLNNDNQNLLDIIKKEPKADFSSVAHLYGQTVEEIEKRHKTGYES